MSGVSERGWVVPAALALAIATLAVPATAGAMEAERPRGTPYRISIPGIGVRAPVVRLGLQGNGQLQVPRVWGNTGWWSGGAKPGEQGAAVIVGHVDSYTGPAVFYRLDELRRGDKIRVRLRGGDVARFVVQKRASVSKADFPTERVYRDPGYPALRLITCGGDFDESRRSYTRNLVIFAKLEKRRVGTVVEQVVGLPGSGL